MLTFDEGTHTYELDGVVLPSISQILKPLVDYSTVPSRVLERAANYGKAVHKMIELEIKGELDYGTLDDGLLPALEAFGSWKMDYPDIAELLPSASIETPMAHERLKYAGTPDIIINGMMVIEIKTLHTLNIVASSIQCAAQENLWIANGGEKTRKEYEHRILHIKGDGTYAFPKVNHKEAWSRFRLLLTHYNNAKTIESWRK